MVQSKPITRKLGPGACDSCRKSKRACDGRAPCSTCIARNHTCSYAEFKKREANQGVGACDRCRKTKRACDGGAPCSTCLKYNATCCYPQLQQKQPHPSVQSPVAASSVEELVDIFHSQWGSLFPSLNLTPHRRGPLYRFMISAVMAQLSRASGDAVETARHADECLAFSSKCTLDFAPECAEAFALLAWNNLNQNVELAAECARTAMAILDSTPSANASTKAIVTLMSIFADSMNLGNADVETIASLFSIGLPHDLAQLVTATVRHLWLAFSVLPGLKDAILSPSGFAFSGHLATVSLCPENTDTFLQLRELADRVIQEHANAVVARRRCDSKASSASAAAAATAGAASDRVCSAVVHPFFLLSTAVQCLVDAAVGDFSASSNRLNSYWGSYMCTDDDIVATCVRNPFSIKALSIATAAALRINDVSSLQCMSVAMSRLCQVIPDVTLGTQVASLLGQCEASSATLAGFDDDVAGSGSGSFGMDFSLWKSDSSDSSNSDSGRSSSSGSGGCDNGSTRGSCCQGQTKDSVEAINSNKGEITRCDEWTMMDSSISDDESVGSLETLYMFSGFEPLQQQQQQHSVACKWAEIDAEWSDIGILDCLL